VSPKSQPSDSTSQKAQSQSVQTPDPQSRGSQS
jgi:hypothetical protein